MKKQPPDQEPDYTYEKEQWQKSSSYSFECSDKYRLLQKEEALEYEREKIRTALKPQLDEINAKLDRIITCLKTIKDGGDECQTE